MFKSYIGPWRPLIKYVVKKWPLYLIGVTAVMITNAMQVFIPRAVGWSIDNLRGDKLPHFLQLSSKTETFFFLFKIFLVGHAILILGRIGWRFFLARHTHTGGSYLRKKIWEHARFFSNEDLNRTFTTGNLMNASTSDVNTARMTFGFTLVATCDVVFLGIITFFTMWTINKELTLYSVVIYPFLPYFIRKLSMKEGEKFELAQQCLSSFNEQAASAVSTIRLQRVTQTGDFWERKLTEGADEYRKKHRSAIFTSLNYFPLMGGATIISYFILFFVGVNKALNGEISLGEFVAMQGLVMLMQDPLMELGFIVSEFQKSYTSFKRLAEIYETAPSHFLVRDGEKVKENEQVYEVKNLNFSFSDSNREIIKNLNLTINKGERVGITGPIGTGKSTLLQLLSGLNQSFTGEINLYQRPISTYSHDELRKHLSIVQQKTFLFADSVKNNLVLNKNLSDEEAWYYLEVAGLADDVKKFPQGLSTQLGEWGINLSGGQKQRLTFARTLASKPKILFLDDCFSAVDTITEEKILTNLDRELKDSTIIWVAHRVSTLKHCHRIIEFKV